MNAEREVEFTEDKDCGQGDHGQALNRKRGSQLEVELALEHKKCGKTKVAVYRHSRELVSFPAATPHASCYYIERD